eukprot:5871306-Amphidinium_carterae.1
MRDGKKVSYLPGCSKAWCLGRTSSLHRSQQPKNDHVQQERKAIARSSMPLRTLQHPAGGAKWMSISKQ